MEEIIKILNLGFKVAVDSIKDDYIVVVENSEAGSKCKFESPDLLYALQAAGKYCLRMGVFKELGRTTINDLVIYNSYNPIREEIERMWYVCECGNTAHLDYVPYWSELPLMKFSCGHKMSEATKFKLDTK